MVRLGQAGYGVVELMRVLWTWMGRTSKARRDRVELGEVESVWRGKMGKRKGRKERLWRVRWMFFCGSVNQVDCAESKVGSLFWRGWYHGVEPESDWFAVQLYLASGYSHRLYLRCE